MDASTIPLNQIIQGDCIESMRQLPEQCVDLIFADPPYNLQLKHDLWRPNMTRVDAVTDEWDKFEGFEAYDAFTRAWLTECQRVLKDTGTIWVIGSYHNIFRVGAILMDLGYWILNQVAWVKTNPMPQFRGVRFTNAHETLLWAKKSEKARYTFNYHLMKELNGGKQMRSDWIIPICSGSERIRVNGEKVHSTQKPEALLQRVILSSSKPGDVVLDPFFGTGTTGAVAKRLGRNWIGLERDTAYIEAAQRRIDAVQTAMWPEFNEGQPRPSRVPFAEMLRQGYLSEGTVLYFRQDRDIQAVVTGKGKLLYKGSEGSIHQVGRKIIGSPCNGWEHWYFEDEAGNLLPINVLRQQARVMSNEAAG